MLLDGPLKDPTALGLPQRVALRDDLKLEKIIPRTRVHTGLVYAVVLAVAGYRYYEKLFSGRNLYVDDLVTADQHRSRGYGSALLNWLAEQARTHGCTQLELDSGVQRFEAHRFYFRERMHVSSYHFVVPLKT